MKGTKGSSAAKDKSRSPKCVASLLQECQFLLDPKLGTIVLSDELQVELDLINVLPDWLRDQREVILELTAQHQKASISTWRR